MQFFVLVMFWYFVVKVLINFVEAAVSRDPVKARDSALRIPVALGFAIWAGFIIWGGVV